MNLLFIIIYWLLAILSLLSLIMIVTFLVFFLKRREAVQFALSNTLGCGKQVCETKIEDLSIPIQSGTTYNKDVAKYCANLVYRVSKAAMGEDTLNVNDLKKEIELKNIDENPVFCVVWTHRKNVYIIFRGTLRLNEWMQDFAYSQKLFSSKEEDRKQAQLTFLRDISTSPPGVHAGFLEVYQNLRSDLIQKIQEIKPEQIIVSGHSLGAAVSTICGLDIIRMDCCKNTIVYNFASPRVGDKYFADLVKTNDLTVYRIVNTADTIPTLPPSVSPNFNNPSNPWLYSHCGTEIPFTYNMKSVLNNHLIANYLHFLA